MAVYELATGNSTDDWTNLDFELPGATFSNNVATNDRIQTSKTGGYLFGNPLYAIAFYSNNLPGLLITYYYTPVETCGNKTNIFVCRGDNPRAQNACRSLGITGAPAVVAPYPDTTLFFCLDM